MKTNLRLFLQLTFTLLVFSTTVTAQNTNNDSNKTPKPTNNNEKIAKPDIKSIKAVIEVIDFSGEGAYEIFPAEGGWTFVGPNREITVNDNQRIIGYGSAVFGTTSGMSQIAVSLCYLKKGDSIVTSFAGDNHLIADADSLRRTFAVSAAATLAAGTYSIGYCIVNRGPKTLDNNNYVNGWVMVVN